MVTTNILPILMERDYRETKNITHFGGDGLSGYLKELPISGGEGLNGHLESYPFRCGGN